MSDPQKRSILQKPASTAGLPQPGQEPPNRPLGQDALSDALDALLGGVGLNNPMDPGASSASQLGGVAGSMTPMLPLKKLLQMLKMGKVASQAGEVTSPMNLGDQLLRNHELGLPHDISPDRPLDLMGGLDPAEVAKAKSLTGPKRRTP